MGNGIIHRNNVTVLGDGDQPMVFVHGFGCDQNMWRFVFPYFLDQYRVVLFDYVGHGRSDAGSYNTERYSTLHGYAEDILDVCHALELKDVILVGHSVSSMTCLLAAVREPALFERLVFVCPSPRYINDLPGYVGGFDREEIEGLLDTMDKNNIGWANFLAPVIMKNHERPELSDELESSFCSTDPVIAKQFAEVTFFSDNRKDLSKLRVPALILQCAEDALAPTAVGEYMHAQISGSTLRMMNATGHCPHMSAPGETIELIAEYLGVRDGTAAKSIEPG